MSSERLRISDVYRGFVDLLWRIVPVGVIVAVLAFVIGSQVHRPHHRVIKAGVLGIALILVLKFDVVYTLYFFIALFPFPAGFSITSTNVILMSAIPLLWIFRANSQGLKVFEKTDIDRFVAVFVLAHVLSLFNVESTIALEGGIQIIWRLLTVIAFFYLVVRFVDDEKKLEIITKVAAVSAGLLFLTGLLELFMPGKTIIPGWIEFHQQMGQGKLGYRLEGIRVGGTASSQVLIADFSSVMLFFMGLHFLRSKNLIEKVFWFLWLTMSVFVHFATANRGATIALVMGILYSFWVFRSRLNIVKYVVAIAAFVALATTANLLLTKYTISMSVADRLMGTMGERVEGLVPESRHSAWVPALTKSLDHIFIGHGPYYGVSRGLNTLLWPHNGFVYYLYTIGLLGMAAFMLIVYRILRISFRYSRPAVRGGFLGMMMGTLHIQLLMLLFEQQRTDHQRDGDYVYIYIVWMIFALIVATGKLISKAERAAAQPSSTPSPSANGPSPS